MTRTPETLSRVPQAIGVVNDRDITRAQPTLTADEALNNVPGVYIQNRSQYSQGQRIEIRGAGARAQFGARGREGAARRHSADAARRAEPAHQRRLRRPREDRGAARPRIEPVRQRVRRRHLAAHPVRRTGALRADGPLPGRLVRHGQVAGWISMARAGNFSGVLSLSPASPGRRLPAEQRRRHRHLQPRRSTWTPTKTSSLDLRVLIANDPLAQNPGALTYAEYDVNPDSAAAANIRRGAVERHQAAAGRRSPTRTASRATTRPSTCRRSPSGGRCRTRSRPLLRATRVRSADRRHLRPDRPRGGGRPCQRRLSSRQQLALAPCSRRASTSSGCTMTGRTSGPSPASRPTASCWTRSRRSPKSARSSRRHWTPERAHHARWRRAVRLGDVRRAGPQRPMMAMPAGACRRTPRAAPPGSAIS